jgi:hypothetical protein
MSFSSSFPGLTVRRAQRTCSSFPDPQSQLDIWPREEECPVGHFKKQWEGTAAAHGDEGA